MRLRALRFGLQQAHRKEDDQHREHRTSASGHHPTLPRAGSMSDEGSLADVGVLSVEIRPAPDSRMLARSENVRLGPTDDVVNCRSEVRFGP